MERRKDTTNPTGFAGSKSDKVQCTNLPREYLGLVEEIFNENFKSSILKDETFVAFGEVYPDELLLALSLKNPTTLRQVTCYASMDFPHVRFKTESGSEPAPNTESVQFSVNQCVDALASFFHTFFSENRPVDYDTEYQQSWAMIEIEKTIHVYLKINRDNPELDKQANELLTPIPKKTKKQLH